MPSTKKFRFTDKNGNTIEVDIGAEGENVTIDGQKLTDLLNDKADKQNSEGGFAAGYQASSGDGGAVGYQAKVNYGGGAVGYNTETDYGGAMGNDSKSEAGCAIGNAAITSDGVAVGKNAKTIDSSGNGIDAIQLGTGTNSTEKTIQVYNYQLMSANGKIPADRLSSHASTSNTYGAGTSSNYGHVKLSDSTSSTSGTSGGTAATPAAVKAAYDKAVSIEDYAQHTSTVFVAAANARAESKSGADYVCTGTNDEETIQAAINSIVSTGGVIQLSEGTFYFSNNRTSGAVSGIALDSGIALKGAGSSTVINTYNTSGFSDNPAIGVTGSDNVTISDMLIMSGDYKFSYSIDINGSSNVEVNNIIFTLQGSDSGIFRIYNSSDVNVINSRFEVTESQTSISVTNNSKNILIKNNVFNVYDWEAIYVYGGASNVIIDGNFFKETYSNTGNSAISVNNALSNIMITNNVIDFPLAPVKVNSAASGKVFVYNNMVKTPPTASAVVQINMDGSSNNWNQTF